MAQTIKLKRTATAGQTGTGASLTSGEMAMNTTDGLLWGQGDSLFEILTENSNLAEVTLATITQTSLYGFPIATYGSGEFIIQATQGTLRQITKILVVHDGTTAYATEYGNIETGTRLFNVDVDILATDVRVLITSISATSTVYKTSYTLLKA